MGRYCGCSDCVERYAEKYLPTTVGEINPSTGPYHPTDFDDPSYVVEPSSETKPSNPKDLIGSNKIPLHFWPTTATAMGAMACMYGNLQYGRTNWRAAGVRASIYYDALNRHMNAWFDEGEDNDPDSGLPHLAHALACIAIIIDAQAAGKLTDDRMIHGGYRKLINELTPHVARLKEKMKDKNPKHYTIADNEGWTPSENPNSKDGAL